jgi:hypothetical protein
MKNGIVVGSIAGLFSGISGFVFTIIHTDFMGLSYPYSTVDIIPISNIATNEILLGVIWGTIFGIFYSILYDSIPGQGLSKGLTYGMIAFLISRIRPVFYAMSGGDIPIAIAITFVGFFMFLIYGLVLGYLYKPPK